MTVLYPPTSPEWEDLYSLDEALAADGEKLRQLTGEDHGPWFITPCPVCGGAGEWDEGPLSASSGATEPEYRQVKCPECQGTGEAWLIAEPRTLDDLDTEAMEQVEGRP